MDRQGMTLMEVIVVLIIVAVSAVFVLPSFITPTEQARATTAQNNLLAIYTAMKNYNSLNQYFPSPSGVDVVDSTLSLGIPDDGAYAYACSNADASGFSCTATRASGILTLTVTNAPIVLGGTNPTCTPAGSVYCP